MRKLTKSETQFVGLQQSKDLISKNKSPQCLRIFLFTLSQTAKQNMTNCQIENELRILKFICEEFATELLDSIDKPPNIQDSAIRVLKIILEYFPNI
jgi:hypothetical protein